VVKEHHHAGQQSKHRSKSRPKQVLHEWMCATLWRGGCVQFLAALGAAALGTRVAGDCHSAGERGIHDTSA
jgi:hypothetical protein